MVGQGNRDHQTQGVTPAQEYCVPGSTGGYSATKRHDKICTRLSRDHHDYDKPEIVALF